MHSHSAVASVSQSVEAPVGAGSPSLGARTASLGAWTAALGAWTATLGAWTAGMDTQPSAVGGMVMVVLRVPRR